MKLKLFMMFGSYLCETSTDLHVEDAGDPDGTSNALQTQWGHLWVVAVLQPHTECCEQRGPRQLEHTDIWTIIFNCASDFKNIYFSECFLIIPWTWAWRAPSV